MLKYPKNETPRTNPDTEAKLRHLKNVRDRYRKYMQKVPHVSDRLVTSTIWAEQLVQLASWER